VKKTENFSLNFRKVKFFETLKCTWKIFKI